MIGILLNDNAYEQDIRELLMAFYPGETFVHEEREDLDLAVKGTVNGDGTEFGLSLVFSGSSQFRPGRAASLQPAAEAGLEVLAPETAGKLAWKFWTWSWRRKLAWRSWPRRLRRKLTWKPWTRRWRRSAGPPGRVR